MATRRGWREKTDLEPEEKLIVAYFYLIIGITQQDLAAIFRVNSARVNEAIMLVREALEFAIASGPVPEPPEDD